MDGDGIGSGWGRARRLLRSAIRAHHARCAPPGAASRRPRSPGIALHRTGSGEGTADVSGGEAPAARPVPGAPAAVPCPARGGLAFFPGCIAAFRAAVRPPVQAQNTAPAALPGDLRPVPAARCLSPADAGFRRAMAGGARGMGAAARWVTAILGLLILALTAPAQAQTCPTPDGRSEVWRGTVTVGAVMSGTDTTAIPGMTDTVASAVCPRPGTSPMTGRVTPSMR